MISNSKYKIEVFQNERSLNIQAASFIIELARKAIAVRKKFVIALSGGQTPMQLYALLSQARFRNQIPWRKTYIFWGDERCVPLNDARNNAHQAKLSLLNKIDIPESNIHIIPVNLSPIKAAHHYEKEIKKFFGEKPLRFDLILLGLGENGHTASLFPETLVINEKKEGIRAVHLKKEKEYRISMTAPLINKARDILFLVTGEKKAEVLAKVLTSSYEPNKYPAQLINARFSKLNWFIDKKAASVLNKKP